MKTIFKLSKLTIKLSLIAYFIAHAVFIVNGGYWRWYVLSPNEQSVMQIIDNVFWLAMVTYYTMSGNVYWQLKCKERRLHREVKSCHKLIDIEQDEHIETLDRMAELNESYKRQGALLDIIRGNGAAWLERLRATKAELQKVNAASDIRDTRLNSIIEQQASEIKALKEGNAVYVKLLLKLANKLPDVTAVSVGGAIPDIIIQPKKKGGKNEHPAKK